MCFRRRVDDKLQLFIRVDSVKFDSAECDATKFGSVEFDSMECGSNLAPWNLREKTRIDLKFGSHMQGTS
jgi:hypothetical protein